jgi:hypothetical protein
MREKMTVWEIVPDSDLYHCLALMDKDKYWDVVHSFQGKPLLESWIPLEIYIDEVKLSGDFPSLPGGMPPIFNKRAVDILRHLMEHSVEILPLKSDRGELYAVNVLDVVDCLDNPLSDIKYLPSGGVMHIDRYIFKEGCLNGKHIFKIHEEITNRVFVSDAFKEVVEKENLEGLIFRPTG